MSNELSVISNELNGGVLVAKTHVGDLNARPQLLVHESQQALLFKDGQVLDLFGPGRHTLCGDNVPFLRRAYGALFGGRTPLPCEIFFINKVSMLELMWGTDTPIVLEDPKYHLIVSVRANGQTGLHITDAGRFVVKVVGQLQEFTVETVRRAIKVMLLSSIKEAIAQAIIEQGVSVLEITTMLSGIGEAAMRKLNARIADLGIAVDHFAINSILGDERDLVKLREAKQKRLELMNDADLEAYRMTVLSEARAKSRALEGYTYQEERRFDVLAGAAKSEGAAAALADMGAAPKPAAATGMRICTNCGTALAPGARFCSGCGQAAAPSEIFCPQCGVKCAGGALFCSGCGTKLK